MTEQYDVASVRGLYTGLSDGWTYLNAHAAPQIAERVASGVARSFRLSATVKPLEDAVGAHSAHHDPGELHAADMYDSARRAVADLTGATAQRVILGPSLPVLYQSLGVALRPLLRRQSSVVLSRFDSPEFTSCLVDGSTRFVAFSAAHELLGTVTPASEIIDSVHERSRAWVLVDVSAIAPYRLLDFDAIGADILGVDVGALGGPQMAALVFRDTAMFRRLDELVVGPVSAGLAGGVGPLVDHLAELAGGERGSRRVRLTRSMEALSGYMEDLTGDLYSLLGTLPAVHVLGVTGEAAADASDDRLPRLTFAVRDVPADVIHRRLFDNGLVTTIAPHTPLLTEMGVEEVGGAVTVSLSPFSTYHDVEHLTRVVASLA